jgi:sec-independent protein translocase protein TatA
LLIILVIVIVIFGTSKVSGIGKSLGTAIRDFRNSVRGETPDENEPVKENPEEAGKSNE